MGFRVMVTGTLYVDGYDLTEECLTEEELLHQLNQGKVIVNYNGASLMEYDPTKKELKTIGQLTDYSLIDIEYDDFELLEDE